MPGTGRDKWVVLRVIYDPARGCEHHRQANLVAICEDTREKTAKALAIEFCADETYLIGPVPPNTLLPDHPVANWPGSYYPLAKARES